MDLVQLMYCYINKFINIDMLIDELESINFANYTDDEISIIKQLIMDVKKIRDTIPNEINEIEKQRITTIDRILRSFEDTKPDGTVDAKTKEFIDKELTQLKKAKSITKDGGRLYHEVFMLMTKHTLVNKYARQMNDKELFEFITQYIFAPLPPQLTQEEFDALVKVGISEDKRELLWRLAFNYNQKNIDFSKIEDYFIEKRDDYYLIELISAVGEDLDIDSLIQKAIETKDKNFIRKCGVEAKRLKLFSKEQIEKYRQIIKDNGLL